MIGIPETCERCCCTVERKPRARKPKYCVECRRTLQDEYKRSVQKQHLQNTQRAVERFKNLKSNDLEKDFFNG